MSLLMNCVFEIFLIWLNFQIYWQVAHNILILAHRCLQNMQCCPTFHSDVGNLCFCFLDQSCYSFVNFTIFLKKTFAFVEFSLWCFLFHWCLLFVLLCLYFCFEGDIYCFVLFFSFLSWKLRSLVFSLLFYYMHLKLYILSTALPFLTSYKFFIII